MVEQYADIELINNLKNDEFVAESLNELVNRHSGIFYGVVNNFFPKKTRSSYRDEVISEINYLFYNASKKYNKDKGAKFSTFIGNETRWLCLNHYNKNKKYCIPKSPQGYLTYDNSENVQNDSDLIKEMIGHPETVDEIFAIINNHPDDRVHRIFQIRYLNPSYNKLTPWRKVGEELNLSIQGCINIHNSALPFIKKELYKNL